VIQSARADAENAGPIASELRSAGQLTLAELYRAHAEAVAGWAARLGGPGIDVDDVVHDVFIVVHRKLAEFRAAGQLRTWLYRITLRVVQEHRRRARTRLRLEYVYEETRPKQDPPTPGRLLEAQRDQERLYRILDGLREEYRSVLVLFELEGFSGEEIAEIMGVKAPFVFVWLQRARAQFLKQLQGEFT
jgi:RNA polymerase sigma-70 factor (ECF subfamily)